MAKPKGTGIPSYGRINDALVATSEFKEFEESFKALVRSMRIDGLTYEKLGVSNSHDGLPDYRFEVAVGDRRVPEFRFQDADGIRLNIDFILDERSIAPVMEQFGEGKKVRTFNCNRDKVATHFLAHARTVLTSKNAGLIEDARRRLASQAKSMIDSGHVHEGRMKAYESEAVDEIRSVLIKYRNIRKEALKRAIDEFIVHDVTHS